MTPLDLAVFPLRQRMLDDMRMRKLGGKTQAAYVRAVYRLAAFLQRSPDTASAEDLRRFQLDMVDGGTSPHGCTSIDSTRRMARASCKAITARIVVTPDRAFIMFTVAL